MNICVTLFLEIKGEKKAVHLGGLLVYFCNELNKVVSVFDKSNENILWIKIGKNSLNNKSSNYIACACNSPKNSTYTKENECNVLQLIEEQLAKFSESDLIIIGGDFNSCVGTNKWTFS